MRSNREPDQTPLIMMEPMIDVVFLLLIFFLVSATIRKKHSELPLELPHLTHAETEKDPDNTVVVSIMPTSGGGGGGGVH
ncbi:MAG: ExbD/TolR family protein, partial [Planctomycetota bacterium]